MNNHTAQLLAQHFNTAFAAQGGIKKLRELILTLAMQGKLEAQDPNDPPARELLKEIEAEKRRLVNEGKIKAAKPVAEIKSADVPYALPVGWKWVRLDDVAAKIHYGYTASANHNTQNVRLLRITDIQNNKVDWESVPGCDAKKEDVQQYLLADNDILIARTGGTVGKSYLVQGISVDAVFASYLIRVVPSGRVYVRFLKYFAEGPLYWKQLYAACSGTGQPNVNGTSLSQLHLALPPLPEQRRIVAKIDQLMVRCDDLEKLHAERERKRLAIHTAALRQLLAAQEQASSANARQFLTRHFSELYSVKENGAQLRKTILQLAVMGKLVPQDPGDPPASKLLKEIEAEKQQLVKEGKIKAPKALPETKSGEMPYALPQGWVWVRFFTVNTVRSELVSAKDFPEENQIAPDSIEKDTGQLLLHRTVAESGATGPNNRFYKGQILYSKIRPSLNKVVIAPYDGLCSADMYPVVCHTNVLFMLRVILSEQFLTQVRLAENRVKMPKLNLESLGQFIIPLPPLPEQHRIVAKIDKLMALCDTLDQQIDATTGKQTELLDAVMASI